MKLICALFPATVFLGITSVVPLRADTSDTIPTDTINTLQTEANDSLPTGGGDIGPTETSARDTSKVHADNTPPMDPFLLAAPANEIRPSRFTRLESTFVDNILPWLVVFALGLVTWRAVPPPRTPDKDMVELYRAKVPDPRSIPQPVGRRGQIVGR